jgi:uncharacterized protein YcfJ
MAFINTIPSFESSLDWNVVKNVEHFFIKVNERLLYKMGVYDSYSTDGDNALGLEVEYFHFNITGDDRMRYIGQNIVLESSLTARNKLCNSIITHLYGGRCINSLLTGKTNPKEAYLDFERINTDPKYVEWIYENAAYAKLHGYKFYGTTELHTSLQTAARNFCRDKYSDPNRPASNTDIVEWVAGFITSGLVDDILGASSLKDVYTKINTVRGIGAYYGYHLGVDSSLTPGTKFNHDEDFCVPGPGACHTMDLLFPTLKQKVKKVPYGDLIPWIEQNQQKLYPRVTFHPALYNIENDRGEKMFPGFDQNKFMVYGLEVGHCQYGIYDRLSKNPNLIEKRKCGSDPDLTPILLREQGNPVDPEDMKIKKKIENNSNSCLLEF